MLTYIRTRHEKVEQQSSNVPEISDTMVSQNIRKDLRHQLEFEDGFEGLIIYLIHMFLSC